jgi:hypothetical protein
MSAIADFIRLPVKSIEQLRSDYDQVVDQGKSAATYQWSGYVLATLLPYLDEQEIKLMDSPYDALTTQLSEELGATIFIFTPAHKEAYHDKLSPSKFSSDKLRDYFNDFNATEETEIGQAMLDGISAIQQSLATLDSDSVILLSNK